MVFFRYPSKKSVHCVSYGTADVDYLELYEHVTTYLGTDDFLLYCEGKKLLAGENVSKDATLQVVFTLPGGKGGFGSMLRAIGAQIEKTTNREACRDLSGRRLRDVNEEERLKKWISKEAERKADKIRRRKERIERLKSKPKHNFVDFQYEKEISQLPERIDDALSAGIQKANKRPVKESEASSSTAHPKKKCLWMDDELSATSTSDSDSPETTNSDSQETMNSDSQSASCSNLQQDSKSDELVTTQYEGHCSKSENNEASTSSFYNKFVYGNEVISDQQPTTAADSVSSTVLMENEILQKEEFLETSQNQEMEINVGDTPVKAASVEDCEPIDLVCYTSISEVEALGLERLKHALMARGLKCGGTITDRAQRLWTVRNLNPDQYPSNLLAKKKK